VTPEDAARIVALLGAAFPAYPATKETVAVYAYSLADLDYNDVKEACLRLLRTEARWPAIATIRLAVVESKGVLPPTPEEAWAEVARLAARYGSRVVPNDEYTHPIIGDVVRTIGWHRICTGFEGSTAVTFRKIYENMRTRWVAETVSNPQLPASTATGELTA
jgi:hypothetical protein